MRLFKPTWQVMDVFPPAWRSRKKDKALKAVAEIFDDLTLLRVVKEARCKEAREMGVAKIVDQKVLANIALSSDIFSTIGYLARNRITDQETLAYILANATTNPLMRVGTIKMIKDPAILAHYAMNDSFRGVREAAKKMLANAHNETKCVKV